MHQMDDALERRVCVEVLGISPDRCPPDYYTLLDISSECLDKASIEAAVKARANSLGVPLPAELQIAARRIRKRIAKAGICLLDVNARAAYDAALQGRQRVDPPQSASPLGDQLPSLEVELLPPLQAGSLPPLEAQPTERRLSSGGVKRKSKHSSKPQVRRPVNHAAHKQSTALAKPETVTKKRVLFFAMIALASVGIMAILTFIFFSAPSSEVENGADVTPVDAALVHSADSLEAATSNSAPAAIPAAKAPDPVVKPEITKDIEPLKNDSEERNLDQSPSTDVEPRVATRSIRDTPGDQPSPNQPTPNRGETSQPNAPAIPIAPLNPADALGNLVDEATLPPIRLADTDLANMEEKDRTTDFGAIGSDAVQGLEILIDEPVSQRFQNVNFQIVKSTSENESQNWEIHLVTLPESGDEETSLLDVVRKGTDETIAQLSLQAGHLIFAWDQPEHTSIAEHLRNCVLCVKSNGDDRRIPLRHPQTLVPYLLDLTKANHTIYITEPFLPVLDSMFLHVQEVDFPQTDYSLSPTTGIVEHGDNLRIKLLGWKGEAEIRMRFTGGEDKPRITITPRYKMGSRWHPLTGEGVMGSIKGLERARTRNRNKLSKTQQIAPRLRSELSSARARLRSANSAQEKAGAIALVNQMERKTKTAERTIRNLTRSIRDIEQDIPNIKQLAELGGQLHRKGEIRFRVFVRTDAGEIDILRTKK